MYVYLLLKKIVKLYLAEKKTYELMNKQTNTENNANILKNETNKN